MLLKFPLLFTKISHIFLNYLRSFYLYVRRLSDVFFRRFWPFFKLAYRLLRCGFLLTFALPACGSPYGSRRTFRPLVGLLLSRLRFFLPPSLAAGEKSQTHTRQKAASYACSRLGSRLDGTFSATLRKLNCRLLFRKKGFSLRCPRYAVSFAFSRKLLYFRSNRLVYALYRGMRAKGHACTLLAAHARGPR